MSTEKRTIIIALLITVISWFVVMPVAAQNEINPINTGDAILVQFDAKTTEAERSAAIESMGGVMVEWLAPIHVARVQTDAKTTNGSLANNSDAAAQMATLLNTARGSEYVISAEVDGTVQAAFAPNDPAYYNTAFVYAPQRMNAAGAWDFTLGNPNVVIAILDTGVNANHPEFAGRIVPGYDFINYDANPDDDNGHGTHVAGIATAGTNNGIGNVGICGACSLMPVKILSNTGTGLWSQVAAGITFAADNGADIINLSLGGYSASATMQSAIEYAQQKGILVVAAAGNDNRSDAFYPAAFQDVIGVSATDQNDERWPLSNFGDYIDVAAPGVTIYNTFNDLNNYYNGYAFYSGTSMASPHVAGLAGLLLSQDQSRTPAQITALITSTAKDLGAPGWDPYFGYGRVDADKALSQDAAPTGKLSGKVWLDSNGDGIQGTSESAGVGQVNVRITETASSTVFNAVTNANGQWTVSQLPAGTYTVLTTSPTGYFFTTSASQNVSLVYGQQVTGVNFGLTDKLPANSISGFNVSRTGSQVTIEWIIARSEVQSVTIERSTQSNSGYTSIGEMQTQVVGTNTIIRVTDQLPTALAETTVYYRLRAQPTNLVVGPVPSSLGSDDQHAIFLPMLVNN